MTKMHYRVERVEWADIEIDVPGLVKEWGDGAPPEDADEDFVTETLWAIGVLDLMYSGDFVRVIDHDTDDEVRFEGVA